MSRDEKEILASFIKIVGDCGHPWYVIPDELDNDIKVKPLKCPFCECEGAPVANLVEEINQMKQAHRKRLK